MTTPIATSESIINVTLKIIKVARELGGIKKARMSGGQGANYEYFANEAVLQSVSDTMEANNLWVMPSCERVEIIELEYLFHYNMMVVDADTGEFITMPFAQAYPRGTQKWDKECSQVLLKLNDKATGIAHSYAHKTFLLKLFMISTPDADTEEQNARIQHDSQRNSQPYDATHMRNNADSRPQYPTPNQTPEQRKLATNTTAPQPPTPIGIMSSEPSQNGEDYSIEPDDNGIGDELITPKQLQALHIALSHMQVTDDQRHELISVFTEGDKTSSKMLTQREFPILMKLLKIEQMGLLAGFDKWRKASGSIANKSTVDKVSVGTIFRLHNDSEISEAHRLTLAWLHKGGVEVPAMYAQL